MIRLVRLCCIAMSAVVCLAAVGRAQVDWRPLLGEKQSQPKTEEPRQPEVPTPTPTPTPVPGAFGRDTGGARATVKRLWQATPRRGRYVPRLNAEDEREYPAVQGGRPH